MTLEDLVAPIDVVRHLVDLGYFVKGTRLGDPSPRVATTMFRWCLWGSADPVVWGPDGPPHIPVHERVSPETAFGIWHRGLPAPTAEELADVLPSCVEIDRTTLFLEASFDGASRWGARYVRHLGTHRDEDGQETVEEEELHGTVIGPLAAVLGALLVTLHARGMVKPPETTIPRTER